MYEKIFWLDDRPNFSTILNIKQLSNKKITRKKLLENTVLAYDFDSAREILNSKDKRFNLYIIDGDFPFRMGETKKNLVNNYLEKIKEEDFPEMLNTGFENQYPNAFVEFILNNLLGKNFVVHSMSSEAEELSLLFRWPFYKKDTYSEKTDLTKYQKLYLHNDVTTHLPPEIFDTVYNFIKNSKDWQPHKKLPNFLEKNITQKTINNWEYGNSIDLIKNRILPLF